MTPILWLILGHVQYLKLHTVAGRLMVGGSENNREGAVSAPGGVVVRKLSGGTEENQGNLCYCSCCADGNLERGKRQTSGCYRHLHLLCIGHRVTRRAMPAQKHDLCQIQCGLFVVSLRCVRQITNFFCDMSALLLETTRVTSISRRNEDINPFDA